MSKKGNKKNSEKPVKETKKVEEKKVAQQHEVEKKDIPEAKPSCAAETSCDCKSCCKSCCCCKACCCPLRLLFWAIVLTIGFVFYLIVRDDPSVTVELCKTDIAGCFNGVVKAVKPYTNPYKMIDYLRSHGYVN